MVISEAPKYTESNLLRGFVRDPALGAYSAPQTTQLVGRGSLPSPQEPHRVSGFGPSGLVSESSAPVNA